MKYGILKSEINTGLDSEILCGFVAPLSVISNQPAYVQDMANLKRRAASQNVQRWEIEAGIEPASDGNSANYAVHGLTFGHYGVFYVRMPQVYGLAVTDSTAIKTSTEIGMNSDTFSILNANKLVTGEFIQFANHDKVYLVRDGGSNGNGVKISPSARVTVPATTAIVTGARVKMAARYDNSVKLGLVYTDGIMTNPGSVRIVEAT
jgi:hypothetical protein